MNNNNEQKNYTFSDIIHYLNGGMTASEMHDIERASLQDPFLADAIEGYRKTNAIATNKYLNEINALLQNNKQPAEVITMPKRRNYTWQIAASIAAVIGISIFFLHNQPDTKKLSSLTENKRSQEQKNNSNSDQKTTPLDSLSQDSLSAIASNLPLLEKRKNTAPERYKSITVNKVKEPNSITSTSPSARIAATIALPKTDDSNNQDQAMTMSRQQSTVMIDSQKNQASSASAFVSRKAKATTNSYWRTDKDKPFVLSEVEEINVGKKSKQKTDTATVKPEGGWQSFQDYLFTKLSKKDTAEFVNATRFDGDLELEFSVTENGSPYNVKVLHAPDSTAAKTAADALQQGPKWITAGKKEKRLNIRY